MVVARANVQPYIVFKQAHLVASTRSSSKRRLTEDIFEMITDGNGVMPAPNDTAKGVAFMIGRGSKHVFHNDLIVA